MMTAQGNNNNNDSTAVQKSRALGAAKPRALGAAKPLGKAKALGGGANKVATTTTMTAPPAPLGKTKALGGKGLGSGGNTAANAAKAAIGKSNKLGGTKKASRSKSPAARNGTVATGAPLKNAAVHRSATPKASESADSGLLKRIEADLRRQRERTQALEETVLKLQGRLERQASEMHDIAVEYVSSEVEQLRESMPRHETMSEALMEELTESVLTKIMGELRSGGDAYMMPDGEYVPDDEEDDDDDDEVQEIGDEDDECSEGEEQEEDDDEEGQEESEDGDSIDSRDDVNRAMDMSV